jgi:hypothetical protein
MIIKEVGFGNTIEAYIEDRLENRVNIIFSDDNNKGKTIVMQGLMYSIGYESIFPSGFDYKEYYFYSKIEINNTIFKFLRKKNTFVINENETIHFFNSVSEFKYYFSKNIISLPRILKDEQNRMVDLTLFYEIFFIGQDNRSPSDLISKTQFNKKDFENMLYSYMNLETLEIDEFNIKKVDASIKHKKIEQKLLKKRLKIRKENPEIAKFISKSFDNEDFKIKTKTLEELIKSISGLKRTRTREINRSIKLESLLTELNSLNKKLDEGTVKCADCGSKRIIYSNKDLDFDVSNLQVRTNIINSIRENIELKKELILEHTTNINIRQDLLKKELETTPKNYKEIILYQDDILSERNIDNELFSIVTDIESLKKQLKLLNTTENIKIEDKQKLLNDILDEMKSKYKIINPNGNLEFNTLFAKKDTTFSGSEGQEYYFSKLIALNNILEHNLPLIIDSFRDGELSTSKEDKMLNYYKALGKQVILTATVKREEYNTDKYMSDKELNALNYSNHTNQKILQEKYANTFTNILKIFNIDVKNEINNV